MSNVNQWTTSTVKYCPQSNFVKYCPISHILPSPILLQPPLSFWWNVHSLDFPSYEKRQILFRGSKYLAKSAIFVPHCPFYFGIKDRGGIARRENWRRLVLKYFPKLLLCWKSEYVTDENIWSWQIWKVVTCRWNIKSRK